MRKTFRAEAQSTQRNHAQKSPRPLRLRVIFLLVGLSGESMMNEQRSGVRLVRQAKAVIGDKAFGGLATGGVPASRPGRIEFSSVTDAKGVTLSVYPESKITIIHTGCYQVFCTFSVQNIGSTPSEFVLQYKRNGDADQAHGRGRAEEYDAGVDAKELGMASFITFDNLEKDDVLEFFYYSDSPYEYEDLRVLTATAGVLKLS